ncbi:hypothetical protein AVEN_106088-2-1, partial [Araneus ventricosus]
FSIPPTNGKSKNHLINAETLNTAEINSSEDLENLVDSYEKLTIEVEIGASNQSTNNQTYIDPEIMEISNDETLPGGVSKVQRSSPQD